MHTMNKENRGAVLQRPEKKRKEATTAPLVTKQPPAKKGRKSLEPVVKNVSFDLGGPRNQPPTTSKPRKKPSNIKSAPSPKKQKTRIDKAMRLNWNKLPVFTPTVPAVYAQRRQQDDPEGLPLLSFYTEASCSPVPVHHYHPHCWNKAGPPSFAETSSWTISIGDVIAIRLVDPSNASGSDDKYKPSECLPFVTKWGVGQVLSFFSSSDKEIHESFRMEIRWFNSYDELDQLVRERAPKHVKDGLYFVEMDEAVSILPVYLALAPIVVTSSLLPKSSERVPDTLTELNQSAVGTSGSPSSMPFWTISCRDLCLTEIDDTELYSLDHDGWPSLEFLQSSNNSWSLSSDAPIRRGLHCPKSMTYDSAILKNEYTKFLQTRVAQRMIQGSGMDGPGSTHMPSLFEWQPCSNRGAPSRRLWSTEQLDPSTPVVHCPSRQDRICSIGRKHYYLSMQISVLKQRCDPRALSKKVLHNDGRNRLSFQLGDVVCFADNESKFPRVNSSSRANPFSPFSGPWSVYQILALWEYEQPNKPSRYRFDGRRLYRPCELPSKEWRDFLPRYKVRKGKGSSTPQLYASNVVDDSLPISRILGLVHWSLDTASVDKRDKPQPVLLSSLSRLTVAHQCPFYYDAGRKRLQPFADGNTEVWKRRFVASGLALSDIWSDPKLSVLVEPKLGIRLPKAGTGLDDDALPEDITSSVSDGKVLEQMWSDFASKAVSKTTHPEKAFQREQRTFFYFVHVTPPWSKYQIDVCNKFERNSCKWKIRVGDFVLVSDDSSGITTNKESFPFTEFFSVSQVLSIYTDQDTEVENDWYFEIRVLKSQGQKDGKIFPVLCDDQTQDHAKSIERVTAGQLLGPAAVAPRQSFRAVWEYVIPFMPVCPYVYEGVAIESSSGSQSPESSGDYANSMICFIERGLSLSMEYKENQKEELLACLEAMIFREYRGSESDDHCSISTSSRAASSKSSSSEESVANLVENPFHKDLSAGRDYHKSIRVIPCYENFPPEFSPPFKGASWRVLIGDMVIVQYKHCVGRAIYGPPDSKNNSTYPFKRPWAVAEVVNIFKVGPNSADASPDSKKRGGIYIEIRWFYRVKEIARHISSTVSDLTLCEEVVESDHYDIVSASSILSRADMHEKPVDATKEKKKFLGMPVLDFVCRRFWSARRTGLVPCGPLSGRFSRAVSRSGVVRKDPVLADWLQKNMLGRTEATSATTASVERSKPNACEAQRKSTLTWKENFANAIRKLSLSDASKEGFEGEFSLIGREHERKKIMSFLNASVLGDRRDTSASIFIAGPPGTGKTASVFACVKEMLRNQSKRETSNLSFFYLNGMEMRTPFEAYVHLWEQISGVSQCTPEVAVAKLEAYFTRGEASQNSSSVTIVLLDEIDYLVTKNQSILYNFFDWPMRPGKHKLVLLGISNTLNLPEFLHARVQSRIGARRCIFKAYEERQIIPILKSKLELAAPGVKLFEDDAVIYAAKTTSVKSGDLRQAFHFCRAAAEKVLNENTSQSYSNGPSPVVRISDVLKVSRDSFHSSHIRAVSMCAPFEALILVAMVLLSRSTGRSGFDIEEIVVKMESIANAFGETLYLPPPSLGETLDLLARLGETQLLRLESSKTSSVSFRASLAGSGGPWPLASLVVEDHEVLKALKETPHRQLALKYLGRMSKF